MSKAINDVMAERLRQQQVEGWTAAHDDQHSRGELAIAGGCYAICAHDDDEFMPGFWPWHASWWKPKSARQDLVRAAALIVAEIERIDRAGEQP